MKRSILIGSMKHTKLIPKFIMGRDSRRLEMAKECLFAELDEIVKQQGFTKNRRNIVQCIRNIDRGYVPRYFIRGRYKPIRKLHNSLQIYLAKKNIMDWPEVKFQNLFTDYKLSLNAIEECDRSTDKEVLDLTVTEEDLEHMNETSYKRKTIYFVDEGENSMLSSKQREEIGKVYSACPGAKRVCRNHHYIFKMKKKYSNETEMFDDFFKLYLNWYDSKITSGQRHVDVHNAYVERRFAGCFRTNKNHRKYLLSRVLLEKYVRGEQTVPKRFLKIIHFLRCLKDRKTVKNNTFVDAVATNIVTVTNNKEESHLVKKGDDIYKFKVNMEFFKWICNIVDNLMCSRYLSYEDICFSAKKGGSVYPLKAILTLPSHLHQTLFLKRQKIKKLNKMKIKVYRRVMDIFVLPYFNHLDRENYALALDPLKTEVKTIIEKVLSELKLTKPQLSVVGANNEKALLFDDREKINLSIKNSFFNLRASSTKERHIVDDLRKVEVYPDDVLVIHPKSDDTSVRGREFYFALMSDPNIIDWVCTEEKRALHKEKRKIKKREERRDTHVETSEEVKQNEPVPSPAISRTSQVHGERWITESGQDITEMMEESLQEFHADDECRRIFRKIGAELSYEKMSAVARSQRNCWLNFKRKTKRIPESKLGTAIAAILDRIKRFLKFDITNEEMRYLMETMEP